ncbi:MAG: hypothetical protein I8H71_01290 [Xanthomonadaceae bacterium]|nr:hypothetical protein [Xanthomonadaceae bacterium]
MAGGIHWFRWHHGSVTDPKFQLVARKSGCRLSDVLAVWAFVLEKASASEDRGTFGELDAEAIDCLFGFDDGITAAILEHMGARGLVHGGDVLSWEKRQPKREREDAGAAERKRNQRERDAATAGQGEPREATGSNVTPSHAKSRQEKPREEERREEEIPSVAVATGGKPPMAPDEIIFGYGLSLLVNAGTAEKQARSFLGGLRKAHGDTALIDRLRDCAKAKPLQPLEWLAAALPPAGAKGAPNKQEALEQRNRDAVADWVPPTMRNAEVNAHA